MLKSNGKKTQKCSKVEENLRPSDKRVLDLSWLYFGTSVVEVQRNSYRLSKSNYDPVGIRLLICYLEKKKKEKVYKVL